MKKSMLNVITLALVLINLVLTVLLTFSLVSTNNKTNNLITKVSQIIDLDVGGITADSTKTACLQVLMILHILMLLIMIVQILQYHIQMLVTRLIMLF